ncbi:hypothetical protein I302_102280 [Kwoniella bestiolae CBS 10118]|uniref:Uncharacterized protein n=1 Tax=Kwoniella bestiolae CBS 10118 TaxID=1296100 RepID=A0AAJ8K3W3_9TREE
MAAGPSLTWVGYNLLRLTALVILCWALAVQFIAIGDDMSAYSAAQSISSSSNPSSPTPSSSSSRNPYAAPTARSSSTSTAPIGAIIRTPERRDHNIEIHETYLHRREEGSDAAETGEANWGLSSVPRQAGGAVFTIFSRLVMVSTLSLLILGQFGCPEMFLYNYLPWMGPQSTPIWQGLIQTIVAIEDLRVYAKTSVLLPSFALFAIGILNLSIGATLLWLSRKLPRTPTPALYFSLSTRALYFRPPPKCYDPIFKRKSRQPAISDPEAQDPSQEQEKRKLPLSNAKSIGLDSDDERDNISIRSENGIDLPIQAQYTTQSQSQNQNYPRKSPPAIGEAGMKEQYTNVSKGGYPTFSGGGLTDPSAQVPLGFIERTKDGRKIEFINAEDGLPSEPPISHGNRGAGHEDRPVVVKRSDLPPRSQSRKKAMTIDNAPNPRNKLMDLGARQRADSVDTITLISKGQFPKTSPSELSGKGEGNGNGLEEAAKHARMRKSTLSSMTFGPLPSSLPLSSDPAHMPSHKPRSELVHGEEDDGVGVGVKRSNSNISSSEKRRQSTSSYLSATLEMGPRFPFPPSRQASLRNSHKPTNTSLDEGEGEGNLQIVDSPNMVEEVGMTVGAGPGAGAKGPRPPFRAGSKREKPRASTSITEGNESGRSSRTTDPSIEEKKRKFRSPLDLIKSPPSIPLPKTPKSPKSPRSAKSSRPTIPRRRSSSSSATSPKVSSSRKRAATLATPSPIPGSLRPSTSLKRPSTTRGGSRVARGVRFNLSPTVESQHHDHEGEERIEWSSSEGSDCEEEEVGEVRRLSVRGDLGGVSTPTKKVGRLESVSLDRMAGDIDDRSGNGKSRTRGRTISEGNQKDKDTMVEGPRKGRTMVLGGDYLSGGNENYL